MSNSCVKSRITSQRVSSLKINGLTCERRQTAGYSSMMMLFIWASSQSMECVMASESCFIRLHECLKESGTRTCAKAEAMKSTKTAILILVNFNVEKLRVTENMYGLQRMSGMKVSGTRAGNMATVNGSAQTESPTLANGKTALPMGLGCKSLKTAISMRESGTTLLSMAKVLRCTKTVMFISETIEMAYLTAMVNIYGQIKGFSRVLS